MTDTTLPGLAYQIFRLRSVRRVDTGEELPVRRLLAAVACAGEASYRSPSSGGAERTFRSVRIDPSPVITAHSDMVAPRVLDDVAFLADEWPERVVEPVAYEI